MVAYLVIVYVARFILSSYFPSWYTTFKEMISVLIAIAAAILAGCIQSRIAFLTEVRKLYAECVRSLQSSIQYTHQESPNQNEFAQVYREIASAIESMRSCFKNLGETKGQRGLFPFEALKTILDWHVHLGFGASFKAHDAVLARAAIVKLWQNNLRPALLHELNRANPRLFISPYWKSGVAESWPKPPRNGTSASKLM